MAPALRFCHACRAPSSSVFRGAASWQHTSHTPSFSTSACAKLARASRPHTLKASISRTPVSLFHTTSPTLADRAQTGGEHQRSTSLAALDVLANVPVPSTSVDICMSSGFVLNNGTRVTDGSGILLVSGEAFRWRPWDVSPSRSVSAKSKPNWRLQNKKGQFDIAPQSLNLLAQMWPRPDLLILGLGPENRPISPELRKAIGALGMRVEVLDTRNAAAQFNLLATERGVDDVAAALIPIGWEEGKGAGDDDTGTLTHE